MPRETKNEKIIESMNATPIIDTNVNINIPRSPIAFDEKKHKFKCSCCGRGYSKQESYFQKSNDVLFQANGGYLPWCKECTDRYVEQMTALYSNNEEHAMKDFCQRAGWNYDITALTASMETYSGHRSRSRISHYAAKKNLNCDGRKTYIDSLKNYYTQNRTRSLLRESRRNQKNLLFLLLLLIDGELDLLKWIIKILMNIGECSRKIIQMPILIRKYLFEIYATSIC